MIKHPHTHQIRRALNRAFDDAEFSAFCFDYFAEVYDKFSQGMRKDEKITLLLARCRGHPTGFEGLLECVNQTSELSESQREQLSPLIDALKAYLKPEPPSEEGSSGDVQPRREVVKEGWLINPYTTRAILKDRSLFVGRAAELGRIFTLLAGMQSCSVVGARRIGKSSLLYYLMAPEIYTAFLPHATSYVIGFLDLQELAGLEPDEFFEIAVEQLERASRGQLKVDLARDGTRRGFRRFLRRVTDQGQRLVLCCDEFEFLSQNADFGANFFVYLRGLCSNYNLAIVTSSRASLYDLCHQGNIETSQFWNIFTEIGVGLMPHEEAHTLINQPFARATLPQSDEEAAFVLNLAGQHPFFIQIACYHLFAARLAGKNATLSLIERRFLDEARPHYAYAWQQLNKAAQSTLLALSRQEKQTIDVTIFRQLQRNALLTGSPQAPRVVSRGWQEFLTNTARHDPAPSPPSPLSPGRGGIIAYN